MAAPRQAGASGVQTGPRSDLDGAARASRAQNTQGVEWWAHPSQEKDSRAPRRVLSQSQAQTDPWHPVPSATRREERGPLNHGRSAPLIFLAASVRP